jgi:hypothetical protein
MILLTQSDISGERFILVGGNCSNREILNLMADGFGKRRPFFNIGKKVLWMVGALLEVAGKMTRSVPLVDRHTAMSATNRKYYSSLKIEQALNFQFTPIEKCIKEVCDYLHR